MATPESREYRLTPAAQNDLEQIWRYSAETWSVDQADTYTAALVDAFETLCEMPHMASERREFTPPIRILPQAKHLIIYRLEDRYISVIRILGVKQNWQRILQTTAP